MNKPESIPEGAGDSQPVETEPPAPHTAQDHQNAVKPSANLQRCTEAADVAFQLIEHLAKKGHTIDRVHYDAVTAVTQVTDGELSADREHAFWVSYSEIVNTLKDEDEDADPEGIYFTALYEMQKTQELSPAANSHRRELANRSRFLVWFAIFILVTLIGVLAYGNLLTNMLNTINTLDAEHRAIEVGQLEGTRMATLIQGGCAATDENAATCFATLVEIRSERKFAVALIDYWVFWETISETETGKAKAYARQTFIFLENYIFPLLAGALGACVSLLRQIFAQLSTKKLHLRLFQSAELRIAVGTIAGIVVGWVSSPDLSTGISLTPLALAFAAGYGVEIIYNILDRVVAAFSGKDLKT